MNKRILVAVTGLAVAACTPAADQGDESAPSETNETADAVSPGVSATSVSTGDGNATSSAVSESRTNGARKVSIETDLIMFDYAYPAKAGNIPDLATLLDSRLNEKKAGLEEEARKARKDAQTDDYPYHKHSYNQTWQVVTDLPRFLSLNADISTYQGGAHGNQYHDTLIWDRRGGIARDPLDMFASPAAFWKAAGKRYCAALDKERVKKGAINEEGTPFAECPELNELTLLIGSAGGKMFDRVELLAAPYVAGSYAEGTYAVTLGVDRAMLAAVKPQYRSYFNMR